jgi:hypothetical protein
MSSHGTALRDHGSVLIAIGNCVATSPARRASLSRRPRLPCSRLAGSLNDQISRCYAQEGIDVVADEWLGLVDNLDVGSLTFEETRDLVVRAARNGAQAVAVVCTNVAATPLVQELEKQLGIPVFDSIAATLWKCLDLVDAPLRPFGFGTLMTTGSERRQGYLL